ncbi:hypothetical protein [Chitiniphilus eburneus]|nr:hypothetical protein [Chitiniphilus eburneus]
MVRYALHRDGIDVGRFNKRLPLPVARDFHKNANLRVVFPGLTNEAAFF